MNPPENKFRKIVLTDRQLAWLDKHFKHTKNDDCAKHLDISPRSVTRIARERGLKKSPQFIRKYQEWKSARQLAEDNRQPRTTPSQGKPKQIDPNNRVEAFYREVRRKEAEENARLIAELKAKHGVRDDNANDKTSG